MEKVNEQKVLNQPDVQAFRKAFKRGEVFMVFKKASKSGMSRRFEVYYLDDNLIPQDIPLELAKLINSNDLKDTRSANDKGILVYGYGTDTAYLLWKNLARILGLKVRWDLNLTLGEDEVHKRTMQSFSSYKYFRECLDRAKTK